MACLDMFNNTDQHKGLCGPPMSPRISFSNDFIDTNQSINNHDHHRPREAPVASDFEFSVTNFTMMPADELLSKGTLLPFKDDCFKFKTTTLRDELLVDDDDIDVSPRPPKGPTRWKEFLGLRRTHIGSKKVDKIEEPTFLVHEEVQVSKISQELLSGKESTHRDVEIGI